MCCSGENSDAGLTVTLGRKECLEDALIRSGLGFEDSAHHKSTQSINHPNQINQLSQFLASIKSIPVI
jgi:hypothetical protein